MQNSVKFLSAVLVAWRLVTPTEGAVEGETLWVAQLWPLVCLLWCLDAYARRALRVRWNWVDVAVGLLIAGPVLSALVVVATTGDKRAAVNLLWEWIGLGLTFFVLRQIVETARDRQVLTLILVSTAMSLAGLGIWQHFFWYGDRIREFEALQTRRQTLESTPRPQDPRRAEAWEREARKIQSEFMSQGIPWEGSAFAVWEQRLKASREPFAMFALTNTLAGLLASCLLLHFSQMIEVMRSQQSRLRVAAGWGLLLALAYCLILTKSRTAFVGTAAGLGAVCLHYWMGQGDRRRLLIWGGAGLAAASILVGAAWLTGGFDQLVITESSKSLRYRLEYWAGTRQVLFESPRNFLVGVGPGNFRQAYLRYKLPEASEEIADPHNMLLDAWANGGILAITGLLGLCACGAFLAAGCGHAPGRDVGAQTGSERDDETGRGGTDVSATNIETEPSQTNIPQADGFRLVRSPFLLGGGSGFLAVWLAGSSLDGRLLELLCGWSLAVAICGPLFCAVSLPSAAYGAAFVALAVHLLGAGGIAMPAITQTLLLMVVLGLAASPGSPSRVLASPWIFRGLGLAALGLFLGCWLTATSPVLARNAFLSIGDQALFDQGIATKGERAYLNAAEADPLSAAPWERLANLAIEVSRSQPPESSADFDRAVKWQQVAIARDPGNMGAYRQLGAQYLNRFQRTGQPRDARAAAEAFSAAAARYPNSPALQSELAESLWRGGQSDAARQAAEKALELHKINERAGHPDKVLPPARLKILDRILGKTGPDPPP